MIKKYMLIGASIVFVIGCADQEEGRHATNQENNLQPIHYETPDQERDRLGQDKSIGQRGGYPQSDLDGLNDDGTIERNRDRYTTENAMEISRYLTENNIVKQAQVTETSDRILVAVRLNKNSNQTTLGESENDARRIKQEIQQFETDKEIVVFTDNNYWNRMRNINATQISNDGEISQFLEDFFGKEN